MEPEAGFAEERVSGESARVAGTSPAALEGWTDEAGSAAVADAVLTSPAGDGDWRAEVTQRLHRYRSRRRTHAPHYASPRLKFEAPESAARAPSAHIPESPVMAQPTQSTVAPALASRQAVAVERIEEAVVPPSPSVGTRLPEPAPAPSREHRHPPGAKIIEFPRTAYGQPVSVNALADPVIDRPRILEAPEVVPPPPALGGIMIEESAVVEPERRPGIDMPLQPAAFEQRALAAMLDFLIVLLAESVFGAIFYHLAGGRPPLPQIVAVSAGLLGVFWITYQYLLMVYAGTTPGLRVMKLQLQHFDNSLTDRGRRRWRVLGSILSGVSLGMGYAWQFLDEDGLCWHERVTKTYLAPEKRA